MHRVSFEDGFYIHTTCHTTFASLPKPISELIIIHEPDDVIEAVQQIYQYVFFLCTTPLRSKSFSIIAFILCRRCLSYPVIGLDCEWTPVRRKKQLPDVALLQIATRDGYCVLFRTCFMEEVPLPLLVNSFTFWYSSGLNITKPS